MAKLIASSKVFLIFFMIAVALVLQGAVIALRGRPYSLRFGFGLVAKVLRLRIMVHGPPPEGGAYCVANHSSWLDIVVLGSVLHTTFVTKSEVARWPLIGWMCRAVGAIFVEREKRKHTYTTVQTLSARLDKGDNILVFPEGTSGNGVGVLPFKSAFFGVVEERARQDAPIAVIPISVVFTKRWGLPLSLFERPFVAWYGDMAFLPHLWTVLLRGPLEVHVRFHPPLPLESSGRKVLAQRAEKVVSHGIFQALRS